MLSMSSFKCPNSLLQLLPVVEHALSLLGVFGMHENESVRKEHREESVSSLESILELNVLFRKVVEHYQILLSVSVSPARILTCEVGLSPEEAMM